MASEKNGYIKTFRSLQDWQWYTVDGMLLVWTHILLNARVEPGYSYGIFVDRGQLIVGRKKLAEKLSMSEQRVRTCIKRLKSTNEITTKSTSKYTIITVVNWDKYQGDEVKPTKKPTELPTNNQPTTNQQSTNNQPLNKNDKNDKNDKNNNKDIVEVKTVIDYLNEKSGKSFKSSTPTTVNLINGRLKDGYTVDDFKQVIDNRVRKWKGSDMDQYLRPNTLFRPSNFENYLNDRNVETRARTPGPAPADSVADSREKEMEKFLDELREDN